MILIFSLLALMLTYGCAQSQQEIDGISPLPQNRPAAWENNLTMGIPLNH
jgi:hypothetical protein